MNKTEEKQDQQATQVASSIRLAVVSKNEGRAVSEQERKQQVELPLRENDDQKCRHPIRRALDRFGGKPIGTDTEEGGVHHHDAKQGGTPQAIWQCLTGVHCRHAPSVGDVVRQVLPGEEVLGTLVRSHLVTRRPACPVIVSS